MADLTVRPEIEVLSAADGVQRRHWSDADKLRIVEESFLGHRQASATARRHGISRSLITTWRRQ
ncbi:transposase [Roseovarius sp. B08]|uniref:transposase n=1 Tax=Roseovarius sp. B08 TaxID=3449223 RepID=UPI003EDBAE8A